MFVVYTVVTGFVRVLGRLFPRFTRLFFFPILARNASRAGPPPGSGLGSREATIGRRDEGRVRSGGGTRRTTSLSVIVNSVSEFVIFQPNNMYFYSSPGDPPR